MCGSSTRAHFPTFYPEVEQEAFAASNSSLGWIAVRKFQTKSWEPLRVCYSVTVHGKLVGNLVLICSSFSYAFASDLALCLCMLLHLRSSLVAGRPRHALRRVRRSACFQYLGNWLVIWWSLAHHFRMSLHLRSSLVAGGPVIMTWTPARQKKCVFPIFELQQPFFGAQCKWCGAPSCRTDQTGKIGKTPQNLSTTCGAALLAKNSQPKISSLQAVPWLKRHWFVHTLSIEVGPPTIQPFNRQHDAHSTKREDVLFLERWMLIR